MRPLERGGVTKLRAFVIADAHGRHDLVEGLLRQEGLLGRAHRAGTTVVQLGDLVNCVSNSIGRDQECLRRAPEWFDVYLVGNHEHPYFDGPAFGGFWPDLEIKHLLRSYNARGLIRPCIAIDGVLVSHAGLSSRWGGSCETAEEAEKWLVHEWQGSTKAGVFSAIGPDRGGWSKSGGVLWADWREPKRMAFSQVVGHTVDREVRWRRRKGKFAVCIDLGASKEVNGALAGAWLIDGKVNVVTYCHELGEAAA